MLTAEQGDRYRHDGYLFLFPALSSDEIAECRAGLERTRWRWRCPRAGSRLHVRTVGSQRFSALRVRGCDTGGHFDLLPQPKSEFALAELDRHERVYRRYRQNYAEQTEWHEGRVAAV